MEIVESKTSLNEILRFLVKSVGFFTYCQEDADISFTLFSNVSEAHFCYTHYTHNKKADEYNGYNECKEPDINSETQRENIGNLTEMHC